MPILSCDNLSVVIEAGGQSKRMGDMKMLMPFLGTPMIERVIHRVETIAHEIKIVSNDPNALSYLKLPVVIDTIPNKGALGGLYTAMVEAGCDFVAVIACDMPFVNKDILLYGWNLLKTTGADVAIPRLGEGQYEPLHAVYRRKNCKPAIKHALVQNRQRLISWMSEVKVAEMNMGILKELDPDGMAFINLNTKEDFRKAEEMVNLFEK